MTKISEPIGPFHEARSWLLTYLQSAKFRNEIVRGALAEDWTRYSPAKAAYLLGCLWGRLRQMDSALESATKYGELVTAELENT